jgi:nitroreductase
VQLSASSYGLQPYTVIVVQNPEIRAKLRVAAMNQPQLVEGSHVLVFAVWDAISPERVDAFLQNVSTTRGVPVEALQEYRSRVLHTVESKGVQAGFEWSARQAYIALGFGLSAAAVEGVDSTPMEGFDPAAVDTILGLRERGLKSVSILALGYRNAEADPLAKAKKVRRKADELFVHIP